MIWALIGAIGVLAAANAAAVAGMMWAFKRVVSSQEDAVSIRQQERAANDELMQLRHSFDEQGKALVIVQRQIDREIAARNMVEKSLAKTLDELSRRGDPAFVAAAIRADLTRLRTLADEELSDVSRADTSDDC